MTERSFPPAHAHTPNKSVPKNHNQHFLNVREPAAHPIVRQKRKLKTMRIHAFKILSSVLLPLIALEMLSAAEMKVFDWNTTITESNRGFPHNTPPLENGNWVSPINYAQGTFHIRIEIRNQPVPQTMKLQFCIWQEKDGNRFGLESCTSQTLVTGNPGTVVTTSQAIAKMWKLNGKPIEWQRARYRNGIAVKTSEGLPVSNFQGWNWNGEDPKKWYPLNLRYTVVVVSEGSTFSGWENYIDGTSPEPAPEPQPNPEPAPDGQIVSNGGFESGMNAWNFYTNGSGDTKTVEPGHSGSSSAAQVSINSSGTNTQLFQSGIQLKPDTDYEVSFAAYSNTGNNLRVSLNKHSSPYTNYGLNREWVDVTEGWAVHTLKFTTKGFNSNTSDGRLSFWFADDARSGDRYCIDTVRIIEASSEPQPESEPAPVPAPNPEPEPNSDANELLNGGFSEGLSFWDFYTNGSGDTEIVTPIGSSSGDAAQVSINSIGSNTQLFQFGIPLKPNTEYKVAFDAYSNTGNDLRVSLNKHTSPYTNYGLNREKVNINADWTAHTLTFTTRNFNSEVSDGRLSFWFASDAQNGDRYCLDNIKVVEANSSPEPQPQPQPQPETNLLQNGSFENGLSPWMFYTNASGYAQTSFSSYNGPGNAALIALDSIGTNIQLQQAGISLEPNTDYVLTFAAYSNSGHDLRVALNQHEAPYTNYGLARTTADLTTGWKQFTIAFTTRGFHSTVNDGRLYFWFASDAQAGDWYFIDQVNLTKAN